jgi:hypothetical protein
VALRRQALDELAADHAGGAENKNVHGLEAPVPARLAGSGSPP